MNGPTNYERIAVIVPKPIKAAMVDYSRHTGRNLTWCINTLLAKLLRGEISLDSQSNMDRRAKK